MTVKDHPLSLINISLIHYSNDFMIYNVKVRCVGAQHLWHFEPAMVKPN